MRLMQSPELTIVIASLDGSDVLPHLVMAALQHREAPVPCSGVLPEPRAQLPRPGAAFAEDVLGGGSRRRAPPCHSSPAAYPPATA